MIDAMKNFIPVMLMIFTTALQAQEVEKNINSARTAYDAGKLEDARFAMEQALREIDLAIGKEIMAVLPVKIGTFNSVPTGDVINAAGSGMGLVLGRQYGTEAKGARVDIVSNSPLVAGLNTLLALPIAGLGNPDQKQVKVQGYKALLTKSANSETGKTDYALQVPFGNSLMTLHATDATETDILAYANAVPLAKIAAMVQ